MPSFVFSYFLTLFILVTLLQADSKPDLHFSYKKENQFFDLSLANSSSVGRNFKKFKEQFPSGTMKHSSCDKFSIEIEAVDTAKKKLASRLLGYISDNNIQEAKAFFKTHKKVTNLSIVSDEVTLRIKPHKSWKLGYCYNNLDNDLISVLTYDHPIKKFYKTFKKELKQMLDQRSFLLYALLAEDLSISKDVKFDYYYPFSLRRGYNYSFQYELTYYFDILVYFKKFEVIKHYQKQLLVNYDKNPYQTIFEYHLEAYIPQMQALGFDLFQTCDIVATTPKEREKDTLYLAIKNNTDPALVQTLLQHKKKCDVECASTYLLVAAKVYNRKAIYLIVEQYPFTKYMALEDDKKNAVDYVLDRENYDEKIVLVLEEHGISSSLGHSALRSLKNSGRYIGEVVSGVALGIGLLFGASVSWQ